MKNKLTSSSLVFAIEEILKGKVSADDIEKIYMWPCWTETEVLERRFALEFIDMNWIEVASYKAEEEIKQKYNVKNISRISNEEERIKAEIEYGERRHELIPVIIKQAQDLLHDLWNSNKIVQIEYKIPEGQETIKVKAIPTNKSLYENGEYQTSGRDGVVVCINGELYDWNRDACIGTVPGKLYNNELELIADELYQSFFIDKSARKRGINENREFFLKKWFPQHEALITQACKKINSTKNEKLFSSDILNLLKTVSGQKEEHTAEEIEEGIRDLTQGELEKAFDVITGVSELENDSHSLE